jgi:predicted ATPase
MSKSLPLTTFYAQNFKAIRDSGQIRFSPLTVLIGNNGSGKSSLIEAMETVKTIALEGLDAAMRRWYGFEHIWNRAKSHRINPKSGIPRNPMAFGFSGKIQEKAFRAKLTINAIDLNYDRIRIESYQTSEAGEAFKDGSGYLINGFVNDPRFKEVVKDWQFLRLSPSEMADPVVRKRTVGPVELAPNGSNVAEYLLSVWDSDQSIFEDILDTLKFVLPDTINLQPTIISELDRKVYLQLTEKNIDGKIPGWLFSTGTLRILALLSLLRHPMPPPVIVIEELENGLDPRTLHLIIEEIRSFVTSRMGQVIVTTHSPYLLDLIALEHIVLVERNESGEPRFRRPASDSELKEWSKEFKPGRLYTMGKLHRKG